MKFFQKHKKLLFFSSPLLVVIPLASWGIYEYSSYTYPKVMVAKVIDGDTFEDPKGKRYRLFGIDTWEMSIKQADGFKNRKSTTGITYFYAKKATDRLKELIENKEVNFLDRGKDIHGRTLVTIFIGEQDIQKQLLKEGLAEVKYISSDPASQFFTTDTKYRLEILEIESIARENKLNIWSTK